MYDRTQVSVLCLQRGDHVVAEHLSLDMRERWHLHATISIYDIGFERNTHLFSATVPDPILSNEEGRDGYDDGVN